MKPIIIVPARMASTRLPGKPLADIAGMPMICQVLARAAEAQCGPVLCAAAEPEIIEAVAKSGFEAVLTDPDHPSGSDRIWEALRKKDPDGNFDVVINLQGDLPTLDPGLVRAVAKPLEDPDIDMTTLVAEITDPDERTNPNVVKCVAPITNQQDTARALILHEPPRRRATGRFGTILEFMAINAALWSGLSGSRPVFSSNVRS